MLPPLKAGVTLAQPNGPVIETERLKLRQWCGADVAPNAAMLSDPGTARFIAADGNESRGPGIGQHRGVGRDVGAAPLPQFETLRLDHRAIWLGKRDAGFERG